MVRRKTKQTDAIIIVMAIFMLMALCSAQTLATAGEAKLKTHLHKIVLSNTPEGIVPSTLHVKTGHTVVWLNTDKEPVVISFLEKLGIVCSPIINFYADLTGAYKTQAIPRGGTASLCFIRPGTYEFEVTRILQKDKEKPTEHILKGKVIVEEH
jgi:plastocyanin